jgi:hypothetical protein
MDRYHTAGIISFCTFVFKTWCFYCFNMAKLSSIATTNDETPKSVSHHIEPAVIVVLVSRLIPLVLII